jgi:predicted metalloprotease with PDZ domain
VYAYDLSVRGAHFDDQHAFFNGTSLYLNICGQEKEPITLTILPPKGDQYLQWRAATSLKAVQIDARGFGEYEAADYAEAIDHPVEMAELEVIEFLPNGIPHQIAILGKHQGNPERLQIDLHKICEEILNMFPGEAPFQSYVFLLTVLGIAHGGLEHRASSALMASRHELVCKDAEPNPGYCGFLSLVSHEYFHAWNIKKIKPAQFTPYDLTKESYTELLWFFEGFTSYYQDLILVRAGLISPQKYLEIIAQDITRLYKTKGRLRQSACESSFDAWTRFYQQDSNAPNAIVSYYLKGALIGLVLDLHLRTESNGQKSLDDIMQYCWLNYGKIGRGIEENEMPAIFKAATGITVDNLLAALTSSTEELPLASLIESIGLQMRLRPALSDDDMGGYVEQFQENWLQIPILGAKWTLRGSDVVLHNIYEGGPAQLAGLAPEDVLVSLNQYRVYSHNLNDLIKQFNIDDTITVHVFRSDHLIQRQMSFDNLSSTVCELSRNPSHDQSLINAWLSSRSI